MSLYFERLGGMTSPADTFAGFFAHLPNAFWLDRSANSERPFSVMGSGKPLRLPYSADFSALREALSVFKPDQSWQAAALPFDWRPGLVGVLHYDGAATATTQGDFLQVDRAIVFSHDERAMYFLGDFETREGFEQWYHAALLRLALVGGDADSFALSNDAATSSVLTAEVGRTQYLRAIESSLGAIAAGEVYQLCLTNRLRGYYTGSPASYFLRLRAAHPAPYAGYFSTGLVSYCSISPERLLTVVDGEAVSSPIKGTRPRAATLEEDQRLLADLSADSKERAENLMIVDLVRNDLSAVCDPASVTVSALLEIRSYSTVHQLVSEVRGKLKSTFDGIAALRSVFPAGSMTGAPKQRAIELIDQLELSKRAGYAGGFGYISASGSLDMGMLIRTAVFGSDEVSIGVGGGLTSDSMATNEHAEIVLKAEALLQTLGARADW